MDDIKVNDIIEATVTGIQKYGAFVLINGKYDGLIHISEVSNDFVRDINIYGEVGETIYVKILEVDNDTNHVKLSIKDIDYRIVKKYNKI